MEIVIIGLASLFFLGHVLNWVFTKTKIPDLLILIILGYALGPSVLGIIQTTDLGKVGAVLSTVALIVILYEGGLNLSLKDLVESSGSSLILSILSFGSIAVVTAVILMAFVPFSIALLIGVGIGSTSSAIVIPLVKHLSIDQNTKTVLSLESAFTDVLTIIIFLFLLDSIRSQNYNLVEFAMGLGATPVLSIALGTFAGLIWAFFKKIWPPVDQLLFSGEAWSLFTYGIAEVLNFSGALSVLSLGFVLANLWILPAGFGVIFNREISRSERSLLSTITFILRTFFFIYLGLLIQFSNLTIVIIAIILSICIFLTRYIIVRYTLKKSIYSRLEAMTVVAMGPRGLACAVLATLPLQRGIQHANFIQNLIFSVIPISILMTSLFVILSEKKFFRDKMDWLFKSFHEEKLQTQDESSLSS